MSLDRHIQIVVRDEDLQQHQQRVRGMGPEAERSFGRMGKAGADAANRLKIAFTAAFAAIALSMQRLTKSSIDFAARFQTTMTRSLAIMGDVSAEQVRRMEREAMRVSTSLNLAAEEVARAYYYLAAAGYDAEQSISLLPRVAEFAKAGAFDLARATDLLTDAQSALGMTMRDDVAANMENTIRLSDVLLKANTVANSSVEQFSEALTNKAGNALRLVNKEVEEGVAVLAAFADQGVKGAGAGEWLNIVLRDLQRAAINNREAMDELGISVFDAEGNLRNIAEIIESLEGALRGMSDEETRMALMFAGFQDRSVSAIMSLIGMSDAIRDYEAALRDAGGMTEEVVDKQMAAPLERLGQLQKQIQAFASERWGAPALERLLQVVDRINEDFDTSAVRVARLTEALVKLGLAWAAIKAATLAYAAVVKTQAALTAMYQASVAALAMAKARYTGNTIMAMRATQAFNTAIARSPIGLIAVALSAAAAEFLIFRRNADQATDALDRQLTKAQELRQTLADLRAADSALPYLEARAGLEQRVERRRQVQGRLEVLGDASMRGEVVDEKERVRLMQERARLNEEIAEYESLTAEFGKVVRTNLDAHIYALRAIRDDIVLNVGKGEELSAQQVERLKQLDEELERLVKLREARAAIGGDTAGRNRPAELSEDALKALDTFEKIRRAVALTETATDEWRQALQDVWTAQDAIADLSATIPYLSGEQLAEAERMLSVLSRQLSEAQEVVGAEERRAAAIREAAEATNRLQKLAAMPLQVLGGDALRAEEARAKVDEVSAAIRAYEATVTRLRNELAAGVKDQDEFAAAMDAANREAVAALKEVYTQLSAMGALTPQMETLFRQLFDTIERGADASADAIGDLSSQLQNVGASIRSMTRLIDVFGDLRRETRMALDGLADLADNAGRFAETWKRLGDARGSLGGVLSLAVPGIGMVAGLASSIAGLIGSNKEQRREMERLRDSLREMGRSVRESAAQMMQAATIGSDISADAVRSAMQSALALVRGDISSLSGIVSTLDSLEASGIGILGDVRSQFEAIFARLMNRYVKEVTRGDMSRDDVARLAINELFGTEAHGHILRNLNQLAESFGMAGQSVAGVINIFDLLQKAGMSTVESWRDAARHALENLPQISGPIREWVEDLLAIDVSTEAGAAAFEQAVQDMIRQRIETPGVLGAMTPDDFDRLTDWLLSIPGQVDAAPDTTTDLSDVFQRLGIRQEFRDMDAQALFDAFLGDLRGEDLGRVINDFITSMLDDALDVTDAADMDSLRTNIATFAQLIEQGALDLSQVGEDQFLQIMRVLRGFADGIEDVTAGVVEEIDAFGDAVQRLRMRQEFRQQSPQELYDAFLSDLGDIDLGGQLGYWMARTFGEIDLDDPAARDRMLDNIDRMWQSFESGLLDIGDLTEDDFADLLRVLSNFADGVDDLTAGLYDTLDGAMADLSIRLGIMGTDVTEALDAFVRAVLAASVDIPDAARALVDEAGSLDLSTAEGRERLQAIITAIGAMMLGETDADMRDALQTIVQGLGQIAQAAPTGEDRTSRSVQYLRTITEFQGQEIVLILGALEHWARQQLAQLELIAGHTAALAGLEAAVQSAMAGAMPSFDAATIESLTSNRTTNLRFGDLNLTRALSDPEDVDALAEAFAHRFRDMLRERY